LLHNGRPRGIDNIWSVSGPTVSSLGARIALTVNNIATDRATISIGALDYSVAVLAPSRLDEQCSMEVMNAFTMGIVINW